MLWLASIRPSFVCVELGDAFVKSISRNFKSRNRLAGEFELSTWPGHLLDTLLP